MATSDKEQMSENVPQHKRLAMGAKIDGTSLKAKGSSAPTKTGSKPSGGLASLKKQK